MGIGQLNHHHAGCAASVSLAMLPAQELAALFEQWFTVDTVVSDEGEYIVAGRRKDRT